MLSRTLGFRVVSKDEPHCPSIPSSSCMLPDDVLTEIILRLPPQPACLLSASLVCQNWHSLIIDHRFLCRFQVFHRTPMLGIFTNSTRIPRFLPVGDPPDCVTAADAAPFSLPDLHWHVLGCRRSHVLLAGSGWTQLQVLNPMNGNHRIIPVPPDLDPCYTYRRMSERNAAVLCALGHADHGHCHSCPFIVVCVFTASRFAYATRYSSENRSWTNVASTPIPSDVDYRPSILVRNILYWPLKSKYILAFNMGARGSGLYHIECPLETHDVYRRNVHIMKTEDDGLGVASMTMFTMHLWARETDAEDVTGWVLRTVIELNKFLPLEVSSHLSVNNHLGGRPPVRILCVVEDDDLAFIWTITGVFAVQLKSMQFKKVFEADVSTTVYPYIGFFIAGPYLGAVGCDQ